MKPANGAAGIARLMEDPSRAAAVGAELARNVQETGSSLGWLLSGYAAPDSDAAIAALEQQANYFNNMFEAMRANQRSYS